MAPASSNLKVVLDGRGPLILRPADYKATGGEASVYKAGKTGIKIYTDAKKMQRDGMADKIGLLKRLKHPYIVSPEGVVKDDRDRPIGLYMTFAEGEPLARFFTTSYRDRTQFGDEDAKRLVERMRDAARYAHDQGAVMVDANELNWVVDLTGRSGPEPRVFDVDSWAIGRFGASVVMLSIRDWHTKGFTPLSDWFSWGVVTFQVFTGIHPYKGTLAGYKPGEFELRMKANASVFSPGIGLNRAVRDFNSIPASLLDWYKALFQNGERSIPPSPYDKGVAAVAPAARVLRTVTTAAGALVFEKLLSLPGERAVRMYPCGVVLCESGGLIELSTKRLIGTLASREGEVARVAGGFLLADIREHRPALSFVDERTLISEPLELAIEGNRILRFENRLFLVTSQELVELQLLNVGRPLLALGRRTSILQPHSTKWFDGAGIQEAFGAAFAVLPFGDSACVTLRLRELDALTPVSAKAGHRFLSVVALDSSGAYRKLEFSFSAAYDSYRLWQGGTDAPESNIAILPKGVCATITQDTELVIFVPSNGTMNRIADKQITTEMALSNWGDRVVYLLDGDVWSLRMK